MHGAIIFLDNTNYILIKAILDKRITSSIKEIFISVCWLAENVSRKSFQCI